MWQLAAQDHCIDAKTLLHDHPQGVDSNGGFMREGRVYTAHGPRIGCEAGWGDCRV